MPRTRLAGLLLSMAGTAALFAALVMSPVSVSSAEGAAAAPGNNGTVKIDGDPFDNHPDNQPHVSCAFEVDFYGFDAGQLFATVTFEAQPPTGRGVLLTDKIFIGEDDKSGGGSSAGLDAHRSYDLTKALSAYAAQAQQGWHVKLTVHADGSVGADTKHKVFWVSGCASPTTTITPSTSTTTSTIAAAVLGTEITRPAPRPTQVLGTELNRTSGLARTGAFSERLFAVGAALVFLGAGLMLLGASLVTPVDDRRSGIRSVP